MGGGVTVLFIIVLPLWFEFREAEQLSWNIFLALLLVGLVAAAYFLQRYFREHIGEIGEARFDTSNKTDADT